MNCFSDSFIIIERRTLISFKISRAKFEKNKKTRAKNSNKSVLSDNHSKVVYTKYFNF